MWKWVDSSLTLSYFPLLRSWFTHIHTLFLSHTQHQDALCGCEKLIKVKALLLNYKNFTISNNCILIRCLTDCFSFLNINLFWFLNFDKRMVFINHKQSQANSVKMKVGWTIVANVLLTLVIRASFSANRRLLTCNMKQIWVKFSPYGVLSVVESGNDNHTNFTRASFCAH